MAVLLAGLLALTACGKDPVVPDTVVPGFSLAEKLAWLDINAQNNTAYLFEINADEESQFNGWDLDYSKTGVSIRLRGSKNAPFEISLNGTGALFTINEGVTLILDSNIILKGHAANNTSLVDVNGGSLVMNTGAKITGNTSTNGGGVYVYDNGKFTMNGGSVSGNKATAGGAVCIYKGTFTMNNGTIYGNTATFGGGVFMDGGTFTMNNGTIYGNNAATTGGGVDIRGGGIFHIVNGTIYGSDAAAGLENTAFNGAEMFVSEGSGTAEHGRFVGGAWTSSGNLTTSDNTIKVVNGALQ